ncbi:MAG TPA: hypothetical protein VGD81_00190 [Opitutaceae bacterium]
MSAFTAPARVLALLPDERFFVRNVTLVEGEADVASQVELALETLAPFPVAQLYYGTFTRPGAGRALVFAAYRKRFTTEETEAWADAEWVAPAFAALLGAPPPPPATTWVVNSDVGLTAIHFGDASGVPTDVRVQTLAADATEADRLAAREALLRQLGGTRSVIDLAPPRLDADATGEREFVFTSGLFVSTVDLSLGDMLDVRDKADVAARQRARTRDRWLWRALMTSVAVIGLCVLSEAALIGGAMWQQTRLAQVAVQTPIVTQLSTAQTLATRIEDLSTKRLRPFEMIAIVNEPRPESIQFLSTSTRGLYTLEVQAQTNAQNEVEPYRVALNALPACQTVEVQDLRDRGGLTTFKLVVTFKPEAFNQAAVEGRSS